MPTAVNGSGRKCRSGVGIEFLAARHDGDMHLWLSEAVSGDGKSRDSGYEQQGVGAGNCCLGLSQKWLHGFLRNLGCGNRMLRGAISGSRQA